jgi:hypothetical protein
LCQNDSGEKLQCPANFKGSNSAIGYKTLITDLQGFKELDSLPPSICVSWLDEGSHFEKTMNKYSAKWHKSCRGKYNKTKLQRLTNDRLQHLMF